MQVDGVEQIIILWVDGGMVVNNWVVQFLSDILDVEVDWFEVIEIMALGVVYFVGLQVGIYNLLEEIVGFWYCQCYFILQMFVLQCVKLYDGWINVVQCVWIMDQCVCVVVLLLLGGSGECYQVICFQVYVNVFIYFKVIVIGKKCFDNVVGGQFQFEQYRCVGEGFL